MRDTVAFESLREYPGDKGRAGAGAAGHRYAAAAFPGLHSEFVRAVYPDEMNIGSPREEAVVFDYRAEPFEVAEHQVAAKEHRVGIAHRDTGHRKYVAEKFYGLLDSVFGREVDRDLAGVENRSAHVHADFLDFLVSVPEEAKPEDAT
jgi:hypothetical protein